MSGGIAGRGRPGPAGPQGPMGPQGPQGDPAFSLAIGEVSAVPYGGSPSVQNVGTAQDQVWDIALLTGATGVLTGSVPPAGTDGTSLGQLYFCTANRTYYSLIELNENDNKWSPLMTQSNAIREYRLDMVLTNTVNTGSKSVIPVVFRLDDVAQKLSVSLAMNVQLPIGTGYGLIYVPVDEMEALKADLAAQGITTVPVPVSETVNGVTSTVSIDLIRVQVAYGVTHIGALYPPRPGSGTDPGTKVVYEQGKLALTMNKTSPGGATSYGNEPLFGDSVYQEPGDEIAPVARLATDEAYVTYVAAASAVVIPYA